MRTSPAVRQLMSQLREELSHDQTTIQYQLKQYFEAALYRGGIPPGVVTVLALVLAYNRVRDIQMVVDETGGSIAVYFLCKTVQSIFDLGQMLMPGFMHSVFTAVIESLSRKTVDVSIYVNAEEMKFRLDHLSWPQGWSIAVYIKYIRSFSYYSSGS